MADMLILPTRRPVALTKLMPVEPVAASRICCITPMRSASSTAIPVTSIGLALERSCPARSTTVGRKPCCASQ
jgi:hypothetical protein